MDRQVALVSDSPQLLGDLIERLGSWGLRVLPRRSLAGAISLFQGHRLGYGGDSVITSETSVGDEPGPLALILDSPALQDLGLLSALGQRHPGLPLLVFDRDNLWRHLDSQGPHNLRVFHQPLIDPASLAFIQQAVAGKPAARQAGTWAGNHVSASAEKLAQEPQARKPLATPDASIDASNGGPLDSSIFDSQTAAVLHPRILSPDLREPASVTVSSSGLDWPEGQSRLVKETLLYSDAFLRRVGLANVPVLLHGETGVGKEVMARRLWGYSSRAAKPFLKLNCAALPSELIESELFGYEKGAFTGATMDKPGKFELAQNGTILLDEIGDMDIRLQAKLLQVLQDGEVQPLGSSRIINVNVRVMAATHRDLRLAIQQGTFREDLYYRLSVINLTVPPLRERRSEIPLLANVLLERHLPEGGDLPQITERLERAMFNYSWPGNVRELENVMRRLLVYQDADLLAEELVEVTPSVSRSPAPANSAEPVHQFAGPHGPRRDPSSRDIPEDDSKVDFLARASREAESKLLLQTLEAVRWNRRQAAARLNVDYKAFLYKLQKHGIVEGKAKLRDSSA
jgi:DNA-binding NtrC family response regulator